MPRILCHRHFRALFPVLAPLCLAPAVSALVPSEVLVIYNSADADSLAVFQGYQAKRPGVLAFDLNDASLAPGTISSSTFESKIRNPLRAHLSANNLEQQVVVFVLTKGLPHRIQDLNTANIGDGGSSLTAFNAGNATYASVDCELTLLWQDLSVGEGGGNMDSKADNNVTNPFFAATSPITSFDRSNITDSFTFSATGGPRWQMLERNNGPAIDAGGIYLTARLDGNSVAAVLAMIDRGQAPCYDSAVDYVVQDKSSSNGTLDGGDYNITELLFAPSWPAFEYEETNTFLIGAQGDLTNGNSGTQRFYGQVAALTGYGGNHSGGNKSGFINTFASQLNNGAIYSTYESFNGRKFGGVGGFGDHGQLSDWIDAGGTFGLGTAWEPFASGIAKNYVLMDRFLITNWSWVESAWASIKYLSWQHVVIGDPLATASFNCPPSASVSASGSLCEASGAIATVTVTLDQVATSITQVNISFSGATENEDFSVAAGSTIPVTIPAGQQQQTFDLVAISDGIAEGTELLQVAVAPGSGYLPGGGAASVQIEDTAYGDWSFNRFGAGAAETTAGQLADPDGDGLPNLLEYAFALNPLAHDTAGDPESWFEDDGQTLVVQYDRDLAKPDIIYTLESSSDMLTWVQQSDSLLSTVGTIERREARLPTSGSTRLFTRVTILSP